MEQILTNSSLSTFKTCPRKYQFKYELGYVPAEDGEALNLGKLVHAGLESLAVHGQTVIADAINEEYLRIAVSDGYLLQKAYALVEGYAQHYKNDAYSLVHAEFEGRAPLLNPETAANSKTFLLAFKIDRIVKDVSERVFILETKTTSEDIEDPSSTYWKKLSIDSQVSTYYLGAQANGFKIESCIYDVIRKPGIRPKQVGKTIDPENPKRIETPQEYGQRLAEEIAANPNHYFARREVPRSATDLEDYLFDVWNISQTLRSYQLKNKFPRNTNSCSNYMGTCPFLKVCCGQVSLDDTNHFKKIEGSKHRELSHVA